MKKNSIGVLVTMLNPNGWRSPSVFGGGEVLTMHVLGRIKDISWFIILPKQLAKITEDFISKNMTYYFLGSTFGKTYVFKDIIQGISYTWRSIIVGYRNCNNFDIVYASTTNFSDFLPARIISWMTGKKLIVKYHISIYSNPSIIGIYKSYRAEKNKIIDSFVRAIFAKTTLFLMKDAIVIAACDYLALQLRHAGLKEEGVRVNYNGVDFERLSALKSCHSKKYDLCFIGRVEDGKGIFDFIELVTRIKRINSKIKAIVIGDGAALINAKKTVIQKELEMNMFFTGFIGDERFNLLQESKVFVSPTFSNEGFGLTLLEALYYNVPVVAYTHPVFRELFSNYLSVSLIKPNLDLLEEVVLQRLNGSDEFVLDRDISHFSIKSCADRELAIITEFIN